MNLSIKKKLWLKLLIQNEAQEKFRKGSFWYNIYFAKDTRYIASCKFQFAWGRSAAELLDCIKTVMTKELNPDDFLHEEKIRAEKKNYEYKVPKYDRYVPGFLLKKQIIRDYIDIPFIKEQVEGWKALG